MCWNYFYCRSLGSLFDRCSIENRRRGEDAEKELKKLQSIWVMVSEGAGRKKVASDCLKILLNGLSPKGEKRPILFYKRQRLWILRSINLSN